MTMYRGLAAVVFVTGAAITALEITASRALAPFFGTSLFVWANVIGIILLALALGYGVGGRVADRRPAREVLYAIILVAGIFSALIPAFVALIVRISVIPFSSAVSSFALVFASLFVAIFLFFPPVFLLGMVSPFALRLAIERREESGQVAGTLYAVSTIGSLMGIFVSAFWLIPFVGVRETFLLASVALILVAALGMVRKAPWFFLAMFLPLLLYLLLKPQLTFVHHDPSTVTERDSAYQYLRITKEEDDSLALRVNDGLGVQSVYHPLSTATGYYFDYYSTLPFLLPPRSKLDVLIIGLAGGTISRQYDLLLGDDFDLALDGVEIDPVVVDLARQYFDLERPSLTIHTTDGRAYLRASDKAYDVIIVDAYSQQIYIPPHLATQEFFELVREHLKSDGLLAMNVNALQDDAPLLRGLLATVQSVFPETRSQRLGNSPNHLVMGSVRPLDVIGLPERVPQNLLPLALIVQQAERPKTTEPTRIFTDNRVPVELLTEGMILRLLLYGIES